MTQTVSMRTGPVAHIDLTKSFFIAPETLKVLIHNIIDDTLKAEITRTEQKNMSEAPTEIEDDVKPLPAENVITLEDPAEDDFSLEAIGQALDAEIARRKRAR